MVRIQSRRPFDITERTFAFALSVTRACRELESKSWVSRILATQLLRASTSVGANIEEAQGAFGRADFINKNVIALKEAREAAYWLRLMVEGGILPREHGLLLVDEAEQLARIIGAIVVKSRANQ